MTKKALNSKINKIGKQKNENETTWSNDARRRSDFNKMIPIVSFTNCRSIDCVLNFYLNSVAAKNKYTHIPVRIERGKIDNKNIYVEHKKNIYTLHTLCARPFNRKSQTHLTHSTVGVVLNVYSCDVYMHSTTTPTIEATATVSGSSNNKRHKTWSTHTCTHRIVHRFYTLDCIVYTRRMQSYTHTLVCVNDFIYWNTNLSEATSYANFERRVIKKWSENSIMPCQWRLFIRLFHRTFERVEKEDFLLLNWERDYDFF